MLDKNFCEEGVFFFFFAQLITTALKTYRRCGFKARAPIKGFHQHS